MGSAGQVLGRLRTVAWPLAVVVAAAFGACLGAGTGTQDPEPACTASQRVYNGSCRTVCTDGHACAAGQSCVRVDAQSLCLPVTSCTYLASDTQCLGVGRAIVSRSGMEWPYSSDPPGADPTDVTPYLDPDFVQDDSGIWVDDLGCVGNARWRTVPATTDPACGQPHAVTRCRHAGYATCRLVMGTTTDRPSP